MRRLTTRDQLGRARLLCAPGTDCRGRREARLASIEALCQYEELGAYPTELASRVDDYDDGYRDGLVTALGTLCNRLGVTSEDILDYSGADPDGLCRLIAERLAANVAYTT